MVILIPILKWLFKKYREKILIILVGLMIGSSINLWPWIDKNNVPQLPNDINLLFLSIVLIIILTAELISFMLDFDSLITVALFSKIFNISFS